MKFSKLASRALSSVLSLLVAASAWASDNFETKSWSVSQAGTSASNYTVQVYYYNVFTFPDGFDNKMSFDDNNVTVEVTSSNPEVLEVASAHTYSTYEVLKLTRPAYAVGDATITISLTYNGVTTTNSATYSYYRHKSVNNSQLLSDFASAVEVDFTANDTWAIYADRTAVTAEITGLPAQGSAELFTNSYSRPAVRYTPDATAWESGSTVDKVTVAITLPDGDVHEQSLLFYTGNLYASQAFDMLAAPGQFTNTSTGGAGTTRPIGSSGGLNSLGSFGGYVILGFDQPVKNDPQHPYGVDFYVWGNSMVTSEKGVWTEAGAVMVMKDENGNGLPDDTWYELAGSDYWLSTTKRNVAITYYNPGYNNRYTVPWTLSDGTAGALLTNAFHSQSYYPDPYYYENSQRDQVTLTGTMIRSSLDRRNSSYITFYRCPAFGYCDNKGNVKDPALRSNPYYADDNGKSYDGFDISWAVDAEGNHVELDQIDFIKVYTAGAVNCGGAVGEWSTEISGAMMALPDPDYVPHDYYINYIGVSQLQVPVGKTVKFDGLLFKNGRPVEPTAEEPAQWRTSDPSIATVDSEGNVTGLAPGKIELYFKQGDRAEEASSEVWIDTLNGVIVTSENTDGVITCVTGERIFIEVMSTDEITAEINGSVGNHFAYDTYTWENSDPAVGTIAKDGTFSALTAGQTVLTIYSDTDPALSTQITVNVVNPPALTPVDAIRIAYNAPEGELLNSAVFSNDRNATVWFDSVTARDGKGAMEILHNRLEYSFTEGDYFTDVLDMEVTFFGQQLSYSIPLIYGPDNGAVDNCLLLSDSEATISQLTTHNSQLTVNHLPLTVGEASSLVVDGAIAFAATSDAVQRINVASKEVEATATLSQEGRHPMVSSLNRVIVGDGNIVKALYRSDLELYKQVELTAPVVAMATYEPVVSSIINPQVIAITTDAEGLSRAEVIDMTGNNFDASMSLPLSYFGAKDVYVNGTKVYIVGAEGDVIAANVADLTNISYETLTSSLAKGGVSFVTDGVLYVEGDGGFAALDLSTDTWADALTLVDEKQPVAGGSTPWDSTIYVAYDDATMNAFAGEEVTEVALSAAPTAMAAMAAVAVNDAPVAKSTVTSGGTTYEWGLSQTTSLATSLFTDNETTAKTGSMKVYPRLTAEQQKFMTASAKSNGTAQIITRYDGDLDADTVVVVRVEAIDHGGLTASAENWSITIKPRVYRPTITDDPVYLSLTGAYPSTVTIPMTDIFAKPSSVYGMTFSYDVVDPLPDTTVLSAAIEDDALVLTVISGEKLDDSISVRQTVNYNAYTQTGTKQFIATLPLYVNGRVGIDDVRYDDADGDVEYYNLQGIRVLNPAPGSLVIKRTENKGEVIRY
ncbi:MAG: Ig-like domain-containing protein [Bacteroidales bacterium]|nr:Ig-like domain-containing protein [Bacteroidales bacterium]MCD8394130.1 Ig-like domain-containing protein [Bacteroidales bacterium]